MRLKLSTTILFIVFGVQACSEAPEPKPEQAMEPDVSMAEITGEVFYRERIMLSPGAELLVTLEDVSRMDVPSIRMAEQRQSLNGAPPYKFSLQYDDSLIDSRMRYSLRAQILEQGQLRFTSTESINPFAEPAKPLSIMLSSVGDKVSSRVPDPDEPLATIDNTYWKLRYIAEREIIMAENQQKAAHFQLRIGAAQVTGFSGCNSFSGTYTLSSDELSFGPLAATGRACLEGMDDEQAFYEVMAAARTYVIRQHKLSLFNDNKELLASFEAVYFN